MQDSMGTQNKSPYRDVLQTWVAKSASSYANDPLLRFGMNDHFFFSENVPNLSQT